MNTELTNNHSSMINWITNHEMAMFFSLTFLFSWTCSGLVAITNLANRDTASIIILIGAYAPSLSAIVLCRIANSKTQKIGGNKWIILFIPVLLLTAGIEALDHSYWEHQIDLGLVLASAFLVILSGLILTTLLTHPVDLHLRLTGLPGWRFWVWVPFALGFWPLLILIGNTIARLASLAVPPNPTLPNVPFLFLLIESFLWALLFGGGLNEEAGWRGFALPRLQRRFSPMIASIIIGGFWGLWHLPSHVLDVGMYGGNPWGALIRVMDIPRAILFTWLYNRTKGNLFFVLLFHAATNTTSYFLSRSHYAIFALVLVVAVLFVIMDKMWRKLPSIAL